MTFEEAIEKNKPYVDVEDYRQDCYLMKLEHPELDENEICISCKKKYINEKIKQKFSQIELNPVIDGEEVSDDRSRFLIDESTVEHNDYSYVDADTKDHVRKLSLIERIGARMYSCNTKPVFILGSKKLHIYDSNYDSSLKSNANRKASFCANHCFYYLVRW